MYGELNYKTFTLTTKSPVSLWNKSGLKEGSLHENMMEYLSWRSKQDFKLRNMLFTLRWCYG